MGVRMHHPGLGAEFDAPASAVPHWARSGWVTAEEWRAQQNGSTSGTAGQAAPSPKAGKAEASKEE
jgi:hypothetical protein